MEGHWLSVAGRLIFFSLKLLVVNVAFDFPIHDDTIVGVDAEEPKVKEGMDVSPEEEAVLDMVGLRSLVGTNVGGLEELENLATSDSARSLVSRYQALPKRSLPAPQVD